MARRACGGCDEFLMGKCSKEYTAEGFARRTEAPTSSRTQGGARHRRQLPTLRCRTACIPDVDGRPFPAATRTRTSRRGGTGKTRIASAVVHAVLEAGGRAAVVVPHGLMHQWQQEAHILSMPPAKSFTSVRDFIEDAKLKVWGDIAPSPGVPEWLLVSHGFRAPQVRQGKRPAERSDAL